MYQTPSAKQDTQNLFMYSLDVDLSEKKGDIITPYILINLSNTENIRLKKDTVVAFTEKDELEGEVFEIKTLDITPHHWTPPQTRKSFTQMASVDEKTTEIDPVITNTDLHKIFTSATNFIKSPAEVETHRKVDLEDKKITDASKAKFNKLCDKFDDIISK